MAIGILVKLVFISAITILLLMKEENNQVEYFPQQIWSTREVLPVFWGFILISLIWLILYKTNSEGRFYIFVSYILTFLAGSILFFVSRIIMGRRRISSLRAIGAKSSDLYWLIILIAIQYSILIVFLYSGNSISEHMRIVWMLGYFSITLVFWPVIESVFYLGMMFIPPSRIVGLIKSAVLISLLYSPFLYFLA